jgi:DNA-binding MarR family transcriptional regulator
MASARVDDSTQGGDGAPAWLGDEEMRAWRGLVQLIADLQAEQEEALVGAHGITEGEYGVLVALSEAEDRRLRMCDLASVMRLSPSGLTRRIDGLAKQGFVQREASSCDRRSMYAVLTDAGMAKLESAAPTHVASVRHSLIDHLTPDEIRTLGDVLDHVRASRAGMAR